MSESLRPVPAASQIAVVGMACRFPGSADLDGFWQSLLRGTDAIAPGKGSRLGRRPGGYLDDVEWFDAEFFGVSAPEAVAMDPQQRLLHEVCWHAMEDAGIAPPTADPGGSAHPPASLRPDVRGPVGVFVGCCSDDYALLSGMGESGPYTATGTWRTFLANRLSYSFGFTGPSFVIDTGQSSSLAAVHQAVTSLRRGECELAVVAGVQLNLSEVGDRVHEELGTLSPDSRCYTFDARANGIVRGEGVGVIVLKTLATVDSSDRIYCTVLGTAQNNDGGGPGLTTPSQTAQQELLRCAYQDADVSPDLVQYVELHGTGTRAGDPVEASALGAVCGQRRSRDTLLNVGSVKTNIGHLEGAAGIASLIKTAASLFHRELPATLNHRHPNPGIDLDALRLRVCTSRQAWPDPSRSPVAGVSAFGLGGTNCHVVLGGPPDAAQAASAAVRPLYPFRRKRYWPDAARAAAAKPPEPRQWPAERGAQEILLVEETLRVLGQPPDGGLDLQLSFSDLGLDSRMSMSLRSSLALLTGRPLPATLLFDYPTPAALVEALDSAAPLQIDLIP